MGVVFTCGYLELPGGETLALVGDRVHVPFLMSLLQPTGTGLAQCYRSVGNASHRTYWRPVDLGPTFEPRFGVTPKLFREAHAEHCARAQVRTM
jgi:hypothetical protein